MILHSTSRTRERRNACDPSHSGHHPVGMRSVAHASGSWRCRTSVPDRRDEIETAQSLLTGTSPIERLIPQALERKKPRLVETFTGACLGSKKRRRGWPAAKGRGRINTRRGASKTGGGRYPPPWRPASASVQFPSRGESGSGMLNPVPKPSPTSLMNPEVGLAKKASMTPRAEPRSAVTTILGVDRFGPRGARVTRDRVG